MLGLIGLNIKVHGFLCDLAEQSRALNESRGRNAMLGLIGLNIKVHGFVYVTWLNRAAL